MGNYPPGSMGGRVPDYVEEAMDAASERAWEFVDEQIENGEERFGDVIFDAHGKRTTIGSIAREECEPIFDEYFNDMLVSRRKDWRVMAVVDAWIEAYNEAWDNHEREGDSNEEEDEL